MAVKDEAGNAVSLIQSIFMGLEAQSEYQIMGSFFIIGVLDLT